MRLELVVEADGSVGQAKVVESAGTEFNEAALDAARRLRFEPARRGEKAIRAKIPFVFRFAIAPAPPPAADERRPEPPKAAALRFRVRTEGDEPLAGVTVEVVGADGRRVTALTDEQGEVALPALAPGAYKLSARLEGFEAASSEETLVGGAGAEVVFRLAAKAPAGEVVVKGSRPSREVTRYSLEPEEIRAAPGTNGDALKALGNVPGVARPSPMAGALIVRGSSPNDTQVFVDGTRIPLIYHFNGLSSVVPTEALERLDFVPGNFGPQFGRGQGGIVEVGLKSPRRDRVGAIVQVDAIDARALVEGPLGERARFLVAGRRSWVDAWIGPLLRQTGNGVATAPFYYDGQAILEADVSASTTARLAFFGSSDRFRLVIDTPDPSDPLPGALGLKTEFWRAQARAETRLAEGVVRFTHMLSYGQEIRDLQFGGSFIRINARPLDARSETRVSLSSKVAAVAGIDLEQQRVQIDVRVPPSAGADAPPSPTFAQPTAVLSAPATVYRPAAYGAFELRPDPSLFVVPSVRVDWTRDTQEWTAAPRLAARWDIRRDFPRTALRGGIGLYYQPPDPAESILPFGSPGVRNNRSTHQSLGIEQALTRELEVSVDGFYKRLDRQVTSTDASGRALFGQLYANAGSGRVYGLEQLWRYRGERFSAWLAYTLSRSERVDRPGAPRRLFEFDQTHILSALASLDLGRGWRVGARFRFVSGNPYTPLVGGVADLDAGAYAAVPGRAFSARVDAFHQLDVRGEKAWTFDTWKLVAYLDVQNVYNRQNPEGLQYNYNYTRSEPLTGLPILPVLGLRGEL